MKAPKSVNTENKSPKKTKSGKIFVLFIGFFLIIRGIYRVATEAELSIMGILMLVIGVGGIAYYFLGEKR